MYVCRRSAASENLEFPVRVSFCFRRVLPLEKSGDVQAQSAGLLPMQCGCRGEH